MIGAEGREGDNVVSDPTPVLTHLRAALTEAGVTFHESHHRPVYTSAESAEVRGVSLHSGAKALVVKAGEEFVMVVLPADLALDGAALRKLLKCKRLRFATKEEVEQRTGLEPGSIPPFGSLFALPTICDVGLSDSEHINFNAGSHADSFQMSYAAYVAYESPRLGTVSKRVAR